MNSLSITGRIVNDIELRSTQTGTQFINNSIAVKSMQKDQSGNYITYFFNFECFKNSATFLSKYAKKGDLIGIEGHLRQARWTDTNGTNRTMVVITCESVELLSRKDNNTTANVDSQANNDIQNNNFDYSPINDDNMPF